MKFKIEVNIVRDLFVLTVCLVWLIANLTVYILAGIDNVVWVNFTFFLFWGLMIFLDRRNNRNNSFNRWLNKPIFKD